MKKMIGMEEIINMKIGEWGQVTIPKMLKEKYGLLPNIEVEFMPEKHGIKLQKKEALRQSCETGIGYFKWKMIFIG